MQSQKPIKLYDETGSHEDATWMEDPELPLLQRSSLELPASEIAAQINNSLSSSNRNISTATVRGECVNEAFMVELLKRNHYQRTHFLWSNAHCSCFLAQASLFLLLVSFSSGFFAEIFPWRSASHIILWTVGCLRCVCYLNSVKPLFGLQFLRLVTLMNRSSAAEVTLGLRFLWGSSWEPVSS